MKRFVYVLIIMALFLFVFSACGNESHYIPQGDEMVMSVGNSTITANEFRYWISQNKQAYDQAYGPSYWNTSEGKTAGKEIISSTADYLIDRYTLINLAEDKGIGLSEEERADLEKSFDDAINDEALELLVDFGISKDDYYRINVIDEAIIEKAVNYLYSSPDILNSAKQDKELKDDYITVKQLMIKNDDGDDADANFKLTEDICSSARQGEDFDSLIEKYSESTIHEITFSPSNDNYAEYFINSAEKLGVNEVSDVLEYTDDWQSWYLIIKRVPLNEESLSEKLLDTAVDRYISAYREKLNVSYCEGLEKFTISDFS